MNNLLEISDGKLYKSNDMVRLLCHDCAGCSDCCKNMGDSIVLDPYDAWLLQKATGQSFEKLLALNIIGLSPVEGLLLPYLNAQPQCYFLNEEGRCDIHEFRPGICRLFPLGRNYDEKGLSYFLLKDACSVNSRQKCKIDKWLGVPELKRYEAFLLQWHELRAKVRSLVQKSSDQQYASAITTGFLKLFYIRPYEEGFYEDFEKRLEEI